MPLDRPEYVSDLIVYMLHELGVDYVALNPGATTRGINESLASYGGNRSPELITCCHEELAVAVAEGYYVATGKPQVALVHDIVGLQHASKAIYEAWLNRAPVIVMGGTGPVDASHARPWIDWIHTAQVQAQLVRDYVKWDDQPLGAQSVAESILRAYQMAMSEPRGPVYLCFDVELQESLLPQGFELPDLARFKLPATPSGDADAVAQAAKLLLEAEWPVLIVEGIHETPGGPEVLQAFAELLGAPVLEKGTTFNMSNRNPLNVSGANAEVLRDADLVVTVGVKQVEAALTRPAAEPSVVPSGVPAAHSGYGRLYESLVPNGSKLVRIGMEDYAARGWVSDHGRLVPTDVNILGNGVQVLRELTRVCKESMDGSLQKRVAARRARAEEIHASNSEGAQRELKGPRWGQSPISTARLAAEMWEAVKDEDWVLVHGSLSGWERRLWDLGDGSRWVSAGGGTGTGMGVAMGAALAFRGSGKVCVNIQNDGDLLYTPGSLWTAAHHNIPMLVVMFNNRSYYQDVGHQVAMASSRERSMENVMVGVELERPDTDFATLARSFGLYGEGPITDPDEVQPALKRALKVVKEEGRLALVDTVCQPR